MKKEHPLRTLTGIKQEEIAMLLGISRGRWSMFEIGKRDLPLPAAIMLTDMLAHIQALANQPDVIGKAIRQHPQRTEKLLKENDYRQMLLVRKLAAVNQKQETQIRRRQLLDYISQGNYDNKSAVLLPNPEVRKLLTTEHRDFAADIEKLTYQMELLKVERMLLESKMIPAKKVL